jgi:uncharacterized membrane protein
MWHKLWRRSKWLDDGATLAFAPPSVDNHSMTLLIGGLLLFIGAHLVPTQPTLRTALIRSLGEGPYKGAFSLISAIGIVLLVFGYGQMQGLARGNPQLWVPPIWTKHLVFLLMVPAMILLVATYMPSRIRSAVGHPLLTALMLWALGHLLANGDLASVLLFGSFLAYAVYDRISVRHRAAPGPLGKTQGGILGDVTAIGLGLLLYAFMLLWGHAKLIGVPLVP